MMTPVHPGEILREDSQIAPSSSSVLVPGADRLLHAEADHHKRFSSTEAP